MAGPRARRRAGARLRPLALSLCLPLALGAGCRRGAQAPATVTLAVRADVTGFFPNPPIVSEAYTIETNRSLFDALVELDSGLRVKPGLAVAWESPDDRTVVFVLRPGLHFSDGRPVTAADAAASLNAAVSVPWVTRDNLHAIQSVRAIDPLRLEVRTRAPTPALLSRLSQGFVLPADALSRRPVPAVGTGPYRLAAWHPGHEFVFERNAYFRGPAPAFERARYVVEPDDGKRVLAVVEGRAAAADRVPPERFDELAARPGTRLVVRTSLRVLFLCLRPDRAPFDDPRVREAIDLALDRGEMVRRALSGHGQAARQIVPPAVVGHDPALPAAAPDRVRARRLLLAAGLGPGRPLRLDGPRDRYTGDAALLDEVARQLGEVGLEVRVNALDKSEFFPLIESGGSDFYLLGWLCESGAADDVLGSLLHSPVPGGLGAYNTLGLADRALDALVDAAGQASDPAARGALLRRAVARAQSLRVTLPLVQPPQAVLLSTRVAWDPPVHMVLRPEHLRPAD